MKIPNRRRAMTSGHAREVKVSGSQIKSTEIPKRPSAPIYSICESTPKNQPSRQMNVPSPAFLRRQLHRQKSRIKADTNRRRLLPKKLFDNPADNSVSQPNLEKINAKVTFFSQKVLTQPPNSLNLFFVASFMGVPFSFWGARRLEQILSGHGGSRILLLRCLGE